MDDIKGQIGDIRAAMKTDKADTNAKIDLILKHFSLDSEPVGK